MVWMSASEAQWHERKNSEVQRFLMSFVSWQRKPRNERRRCSGTDRWDRHHWKVKNIAEHTSRTELGVMLASLVEVAQTRMRWDTSLRKADYWYLWSRSAENAGDVVDAEDDDGDPPDGLRTSSPVLCGRNSRDGWFFCYLLQSNGNNDRNIAVLSPELMAGGYKRHIVSSDEEAAVVGLVILAILATMADGPHELIQEQTSRGQSPGNGLAEGAVKEVKAKIQTLRYELEKGLRRTVLENHDTLGCGLFTMQQQQSIGSAWVWTAIRAECHVDGDRQRREPDRRRESLA